VRRFLRHLAALSALLGVPGTALAGLVTFDALNPSYGAYAPSLPLLGHGDAVVEGNYAIGLASTKAGAQLGDLVGAVLDGSDPFSCFNVTCPGNNATNYLALLNDGLPYLFRLDGGLFRLNQFDASFIAADGVNVLATAMLLRVMGYVGGSLLMQEDVFLPGPDNGDYDFKTYAMSSAFAGGAFDQVDFVGYACTTPSTCTRNLNQAQFGLDNITMADTNAVPEPATLALVCAGLMGLRLSRRRVATTA